MSPAGLPERVTSLVDRRIERVKTALGPVHRAVAHNLLQPVQHRIQFRRRLSTVPEFDLGNRDVLFLVVDCLRGDHLSQKGYHRETTPFLDSLGSYYPNCVSAAPWTYPAVPSILTGLYPHNHGAVFESADRNEGMGDPPASLRDNVYTLSELLARAGYETYLSTGIATAELSVRGRFGRVDIRHDGYYNAPAEELTTGVLDWWDSTDGNRFGYVHFADLHAHLRRPEMQPFGEVPDIPDVEHWDFTQTTEPREEFEEYRRAKIQLYDSNLRYVDEQLRRLFEALADRDELEDTLVVVVGDHGEEFWERIELERQHFDDPRDIYGTGHGHALVPEVVFVPLFIVGGSDEPTTEFVSTTDIVPTVLTELGLPDEELSLFDGVPLQRPAQDRPVLSEEVAYGYNQQAVIHGAHHLIHSPHEDVTVLLDLETDQLIEDPALEAELKGYLSDGKQVGSAITLDRKTQEHLSDLGYL